MGIFSRSSHPVGLDIGTSRFCAVQLTSGSPNPQVAKYGNVRVPAGAVVEGEIVDVEAAAYALSQLWKTCGFGERNVIAGIASQRVVVRLVQMPHMDQSELRSAIQYQAQDYIPIPVDEAIIDAQIVGESLGDNDEKVMEVLLVAAHKDTVNSTVGALEMSGLKPQVIDLSAFAVVRALLDPDMPVSLDDDQGSGAQATAFINISSSITNIVVVEQGLPRFARVTPMAGNDLTQAVADSLGVGFEEAEELKLKVGLPSLDNGDAAAETFQDVDPSQVEVVQNVLESQISHLVAEIRRSLDYYLTQATQIRTITKLVLSGGGTGLRNISSYLERGLQAQVVVGDALQRVQLSGKANPVLPDDEGPAAAVAIGLALRGFD